MYFSLPVILIIFTTLSSCQNGSSTLSTPTPAQSPTAFSTPTEMATAEAPTATQQPPGTVNNPLVISFVSENLDPTVKMNGDKVAEQLSQLTGYTIESEVSPTYDWTLKGMADGAVHMAWLPPLTYLYASQQGLARVALLTDHFGVYKYGTQFLANTNSGLRSFFDLARNQDTANALNALSQLRGKQPCWVDPSSSSGYLLAAGLLKVNSIPIKDGIFLLSHTSVIRALYINGICDFGATYALAGDPRTAAAVQQDLPDALSKVIILWVSDPVIPNLCLALLPSLPDALQKKITQGMLDLVKTQAGKAALTGANNYDIQDFEIATDADYDPLSKIVGAMGVSLDTMLGR
ncbi:MAG: PhnD/SsuA/transferrin family substrate-binding protein [Anaerolineaceae bacterium]|jgi:phosphonate transport system substrate-binding protein